MYLSEERRKMIRECINNGQHQPEHHGKTKIKYPHQTKEGRKISQLLFEARDGKEVFTPF